MVWNDLKKCKIEDIVGYINELLEQNNYNFTKVSSGLGASESTIRKFITSRGYKRLDNIYQYVGEKDDRCNLRGNTPNDPIINDSDDSSMTGVISSPDIKENLIYLTKEADTLKSMINWFKTRDDICNTGVIEVKEGIHIDLPEANMKRTTIRINEVIWNEFDKFVEDNKPYEKHTLMAQALKEYMDKYKD